MSTLIITSSVIVNSSFTALTNADIRLQQYLSSIKFYIKIKNIDAIIVCDNSGFDYSTREELITMADKYSKEIEFLSFVGNREKMMEYGKGYGEGEIMSFIVANSSIYKNGTTSFFKVTGRLIISNIQQIINVTSENKNFFQRTYFNPFLIKKTVSTVFYHVTKKSFEDNLLNAYLSVDDSKGNFLEHSYFKNITDTKMDYYYFSVFPVVKGMSGSTGGNYDLNERALTIRNIINSFLCFTERIVAFNKPRYESI